MDARIAIVGAGPAGALLSYLLSSRGIETLLIERQTDFSREFRGEILMPSGIRALGEAGFPLDDVATRVPEILSGYLNRKPFITIDSARFGDLAPTAVSQPELLESLVARAAKTGSFELRRGHSVRGLSRDSDGSFSVRLAVSGRDHEETIRVPYLIGADGRSSIVRRRLDHRVRERKNPLDVVWFKMPFPTTWKETHLRFEIGHGHLLIAVPSPDGLLQVAWVIPKGSYGALKKRGIEQWIDAMSDHADPELAAHLRAHRNDFSRPFLLDVITDRVAGWAKPNSLLIGDAAHTMSPVGGQGLNLALRDAIVAANLLVPAIREGRNIDEAAAGVETLRGPEIDRIQMLAAIPPRIMMGRTVMHGLASRVIARLAGTRLAQLGGGGIASSFLDGVTDVHLSV